MILSGTRQLVLKSLEGMTPGEIEAWESILSKALDCRQAFLSPTYARCVAESGAGKVYVLVGMIDGAPVWFLPVQTHRDWIGRFGVLEPVGGVMSDYFGAVAEEGARFTPSEIFAATRGKFSACLFTHLDETQLARGLSGETPRIGLRTRIDSAQDYWEQLRQKDKKLVYDTERRQKKLVKEHGESHFEWQSTNRTSDLAALIELKKSQYTRTGKSEAPLFVAENVALLTGLAKSTATSCEGVLSTLRCGGHLVAAHFGLRCHEKLHVWFPVYDQKYAPFSPGRILLKHIINESTTRGITVLDRGEGDTQAKRDFSNEEHRYFRGQWVADSISGRIARLASGIHWRI